MINYELPATLPASFKEQMKAFAPYMTRFDLKRTGGFDENFLKAHGLSCNIQYEEVEPVFIDMIPVTRREPQYADVTLEYR